jgi:hypothetical protein
MHCSNRAGTNIVEQTSVGKMLTAVRVTRQEYICTLVRKTNSSVLLIVYVKSKPYSFRKTRTSAYSYAASVLPNLAAAARRWVAFIVHSIHQYTCFYLLL